MKYRGLLNILNRSKNQKGFTLMEMVISASLLSVMLLALYGVLDLANVIFNTNNAYASITQGSVQSLRYISREIGQTNPSSTPARLVITTDADLNSVVRFQVPVDWDNDGDIVTTALDPIVEWGAYEDPGHTRACHSTSSNPSCTTPANSNLLGRWVQYSVVNNQLVRDVLGGGLAPIQNLQRVVANSVQNFTVNQNVNTLNMSLTTQVQDQLSTATGHSEAYYYGGSEGESPARTLQATFTSSTTLRNEV